MNEVADDGKTSDLVASEPPRCNRRPDAAGFAQYTVLGRATAFAVATLIIGLSQIAAFGERLHDPSPDGACLSARMQQKYGWTGSNALRRQASLCLRQQERCGRINHCWLHQRCTF